MSSIAFFPLVFCFNLEDLPANNQAFITRT